MTSSHPDLRDLADALLLTEVKRLAVCERQATVALVAALAEVDRRRLYLDEGYASLFVYATDVLRLSESAAYRRIEAARVMRRFPVVLERLAAGDVTLTTITLLAAHLTAGNVNDLLTRATHRKKREVELLVATLHPQPDARTSIRRLPQSHTMMCGGGPHGPATFGPARVAAAPGDFLMPPGPHEAAATVPACETAAPGSSSGASSPLETVAYELQHDTTAPSDYPMLPASPLSAAVPARASTAVAPIIWAASRPALITPLAPTRYKLQVTIGEQTEHLLRRAQDLLRHRIPDGDLEAVLHRALALLVEAEERRRFAAGTIEKRSAAGSSTPNRPAPSTAVGTTANRLGRTSSPLASPQHTIDEGVTRNVGPGTDAVSGLAATPARTTPGGAVDADRATRRIPAVVKRAVWRRDEGRCAFVGNDGHRCAETGRLEFHHVTPWAVGGQPTAEGLSLRCRSHNLREAERFFGEDYMLIARARAGARARADIRDEVSATRAGAS